MAKKKTRQARKNRKIAWAILVAFLIFLAYLYIGGDYGLWQHWKLSQKRDHLEKELATLRREQDSLRTVIQKLKTDSSYIEKVAREKYNMGKPDEEIIRIIKKELP